MWVGTLMNETLVTIRLFNGAVVSMPIAQRGRMWDFAAD